MLYTLALALHSWIRWLVLVTLVFAIYRGFRGWFGGAQFKRGDATSRAVASVVVRIQFVVGIVLYIVSPITRYFISNIKAASGMPEVATFGWMHPVGMIIAIAVISIGEVRSKKAAEDRKKFSRMAVFYLIALVIIFAAIPWPFYQIGGRPLFRPF